MPAEGARAMPAVQGHTWAWVAGGAALLALPAAANGIAFTYFDSADYIARPDGPLRMLARLAGLDVAPRVPSPEELAATRPEDMPLVHRGRSIFYRSFGWAGLAAGQLWPVVVLQALAVSATLMILWRRVLGRAPGPMFLALVAGLAALTPLGYFTGLVMPDALTGVAVLAAALMLCCRGRLSGGEQVFLALLLLFAMLSHATHVLIVAGLIALAVVFRGPVRRAGADPSAAGAAVVAGALVVAVLFELVYVDLYNRRAAAPLVTYPHITAGLVDAGPGAAFLQRNCPEAGFALCDWADRLPMLWTDFLFDETDPARGAYAVATPAEARAIAAEQLRFLRAVAADDPGGMALYALDQTLRQLVRFGMFEAMIPPGPRFEGIRPAFPEAVATRIEASRLHRNPWLLDVVERLTQATALAALGLAAVAAVRLRRRGPAEGAGPAVVLALALIAGLVLNAIVCGVIAAPYDRFQARLIWLWPLAALMLFLATRPAGAPDEAPP